MAGIGFELYRILHKGTLSSILKAFFLGIIIVAGPWILSVISIYLIQKFAFSAISENPALFTVTIVYVYAFSLFLFGGFHYIFSRYIADMLYIEDHASIPPALISIVLVTILLSSLISCTFIYFNDFTFVKTDLLYRCSLVFLFAVINILWIMLIYVALLKEYNKIFFAYLAGTVLSIGGVFILGKNYGVAGSLFGYSVGQFFIILILFLISLKSYPVKRFSINTDMFKYFFEFKYLFFMGLFFNMAIWADKILYWFINGINIPGTLFYYFIQYDIPVFLAYITMIPGLVYFLVVSETIFHRKYLDFVKNLLSDTIREMNMRKEAMLSALKKGGSGLVLFQLVWTAALILNINDVLKFMGYSNINTTIMIILLVAVFFHMCSLVLQIYLLYLELRKEALLAALIYLLCNSVFTLAGIFYLELIPGTSYLAASLLSSSYCLYHLLKKAPVIDFILFTRG